MKIFKYFKSVFIILNIILCCHGDLKAGYSSIQYGYRFLYRMIESYVNYSILDCVEECLRTKRCTSVNYYKGANFCEINYSRNITQPAFYRQASGWLYTDIQYWDEALAEVCAGSPCKINEKCIPKPFGQFECLLSDCGIPVDIIRNTTWNVQEWEGIGIRKRMHIKCLDSFEQRGSGMIVCHKNGTWMTDLVCQDKTCLQGYTLYQTSVFTTCLKYVSENVRYTEAVSSCKQDGGDLIRIDSKQKFDIFKNHAGQYVSSFAIQVWVQGEKINGQWKFHDGTPIPDICPFNETHQRGEVHIRSRSDYDYECWDISESKLFHYMCEIHY